MQTKQDLIKESEQSNVVLTSYRNFRLYYSKKSPIEDLVIYVKNNPVANI